MSLPPASVFPWFVRVRTRRYLLGRVGVHSVVGLGLGLGLGKAGLGGRGPRR